MKKSGNLWGARSLEFAAGRYIHVFLDGKGLIYEAAEYSYLIYRASPIHDYKVDHWQATP